MRVDDVKELPRVAREALKDAGFRELFPPQVEALRKDLLNGANIVVSAPTASGKSLIALMAALKHILENRKVIYVAPLKSLVYEKAQSWGTVISKVGGRLAVSTGDYDRIEPGLARANMVLMTYEKLDSLLRHGVTWLYNIGLLIVDEIHYISDTKRGPVLEVSLARILSRSSTVQVVAMSATISNALDVAKWLNAELVLSNWRPVQLREGILYRGKIVWSNGEEERVRRYTGDASIDAALDCIEDGGQSLVFVQSRRKAVNLALKLLKYAEKNPRIKSVLGQRETLLNEARVLEERSEHRELNRLIARLLRIGIGFHHAGLASYQREVIERLFRGRFISVLVATPTLAAGVNLPARRVVVDSLYRYRGGGVSEPISVSEYKQLAGRAGRPGLDPYGEAVIVARTSSVAQRALYSYVRGTPEPIVSKLSSEKAMRSQVLAVIAAEKEINVDLLVRVFSRTFYAAVFANPAGFISSALSDLEKMGFIAIDNEVISATPIGLRTAELYVDPITAYRMLRSLSKIEDSEEGFELKALFVSLWNPDAQLLRLPPLEEVAHEVEAESLVQELGYEVYHDVNEYDIAMAARALYTARMLLEWMDEVDEDSILAKYGIDPGDLHAIVSTAEWLLYSFAELARVAGSKLSGRLGKLRVRVAYGVKEELVDLVQVPQIGRVRARVLYNAGIRSKRDLTLLGPEQLAALVKGLGLSRAREILEALRREH